MQKSINKGFTLIELLVVIAIIGILASIVLVALGNARQKGADAGIQGNLDTIRTQAEVYAGSNSNSYNPTTAISAVGTGNQATAVAANSGTACGGAVDMWGDPTIKQALIAANNSAGTQGIGGAVCVWGSPGAVAKAATTWYVAVPLKSDVTKFWCVDSGGKAGSVAIGLQFDTVAHAATFAGCP